MERPSFVGHYTQFLEEDNSHYPGSDELLSIGSAVGKKLGLSRIGVHVETLLPGRRTSYPHAESDEEEFGFVLEGNLHVWIDGCLHALKPGDFVALPAGTGIAHTFLNNSDSVVRLLVGGEATKKTNKIIYPLNDEQNLVKKTQEQLWENAPKHVMGPHNGLPDRPSKNWKAIRIMTDRMILRPFEFSDSEAVFNYARNPNVAKWVTWEPHKSLADSMAFIRFAHDNYLKGNTVDPLAITLKSNPGYVIGAVGAFWVNRPHKIMELGATLSEEYWGKGLMVEALRALVDHCWKNSDVVRIQSRCKLGNLQSRKMMQKMGMTFEGLMRSSLYCKGKHWDMEMFGLVRK